VTAAGPADTGVDGAGGRGDGPDGLSYAEALDELEDLLDELEGADVDVDVLAERVARGVELIRFCRGRLEVVTGDVDAVVAELVAIQGGGAGAGAVGDGGPGDDPADEDPTA
jgi:exodeoxyribonuclease VII small subunit